MEDEEQLEGWSDGDDDDEQKGKSKGDSAATTTPAKIGSHGATNGSAMPSQAPASTSGGGGGVSAIVDRLAS